MEELSNTKEQRRFKYKKLVRELFSKGILCWPVKLRPGFKKLWPLFARFKNNDDRYFLSKCVSVIF